MEINIVHLGRDKKQFVVEMKLGCWVGSYDTLEEAQKIAFEIAQNNGLGWVDLKGSILPIKCWISDGEKYIPKER